MYPKTPQIEKKAPKNALTKMALVAACLMLTAVPSANAQNEAKSEAQVLKQLNDLVKAKRYAEAYVLSNKHVMDYGGEARFDFLMGMAAMKTKAYEESVFAFERAVINKPKWEQARFQLARAYYHVDNLSASKNELVKLKEDSSDPDFISTIDGFIAQVDSAITDKKRQFKQVFSVSGGFDTNINSGTSINEVFIEQFGTTIPLSDESRETEDLPFNLSYQAQYQEPFSQNSLLIGQIALFSTDYKRTPSFERTLADVSLKFQDVLGDFTYQIGTFFRPMLLAETHYRDQYGFSTNWMLPINANWGVSAQVGFGKIDSRISTSLDVRDVFATTSARYRSGRWQHIFSANHTDIRSVEFGTKHQSYHYYKLDYKTTYVVTPKHQANFEVQWQKSNYDVVHPVFGAVRDEDFARAGVGWRYLLNESMLLEAKFRHSNKRSNVPIYAYNRDEYSIGFTVQF